MPNTVPQRQPSVIPTGPVCDSADQCISARKQLPANDISAAGSERVSRHPVLAAALPADGPCTVRSGRAPSPVRRLPTASGRLRQSSLQRAPPEPVPAARTAPCAATPPDIVPSIAAPDPRAAAETQHCGPSAAASVYQPSRRIRRRRCAGYPVEPVDRAIPPAAAAAAAAAQLRPRRIPAALCGCWLRSPFLWSSTNVSPAPAVPRQLWPAGLAAAAAAAATTTSDVREPSNHCPSQCNAASVDSGTRGRGRCCSSSSNRSTRRHSGKERSSTPCEAQA